MPFSSARHTSKALRAKVLAGAARFGTAAILRSFSGRGEALAFHDDSLIRTIRGQKVLLDAGLASIYGVPTKRLSEQVKRNAERFPDDFVFQLTNAETASINRCESACAQR